MPAPVTAGHVSDYIIDGQRKIPILQLDLNISSSGVNILLSPVPGKIIRVLQYVFVASASVTVTFESSGGQIEGGPMSCIANSGVCANFSPIGWVETNKGEGLNMGLSSGVQVGGHLSYVLV